MVWASIVLADPHQDVDLKAECRLGAPNQTWLDYAEVGVEGWFSSQATLPLQAVVTMSSGNVSLMYRDHDIVDADGWDADIMALRVG